jgi:hypothetical protein
MVVGQGVWYIGKRRWRQSEIDLIATREGSSQSSAAVESRRMPTALFVSVPLLQVSGDGYSASQSLRLLFRPTTPKSEQPSHVQDALGR